MEQLLAVIAAAAATPVQTTLFPRQPGAVPTMETIQAKLDLIKMLDDIPQAHSFVSDFQSETVQTMKALTSMMGTVGIELTADQLKAINDKVDSIINAMETEIKSKFLAAFRAGGIDALLNTVR